mmetsp:Transcript_37784/g.99920  ORF Transcript_37784/g.99920 Transcript_37784/m.99920 type:complete len:440 (-) Transcript_37784:144-1463(-)|eukprot:CAMPEP_0115834390 /NCGR_PEP_ID=MMETSP0287-20121206/3658_1 /TAXON_ID=412157 /ORGANISM="Chrysochromulina rotalis, Strain UIO044" /LENGTH=439 /DNA_ID=CAMNT_0003287823 /DNA_START=18 /DNA_END=1337 /DNA_ORIENTATION=-
MDELNERAATAPARVQRLTRKTLRRLTALPPHKVRREQRHYPPLPPAPGSSTGIQIRGLDDVPRGKLGGAGSDSDDDDKPVEKLDATERRKRFLTTSNLKRVFRTLDLGDDGHVDADDLYEAQKRIGGKLDRDEVRDILWEVDDSMSGRLSMADYMMTYKRLQADESGFEPKRFYSIVEFLLMDRDCSGEISLDEAMTTIFERQGADDLASFTKQFFDAAGVGAGGDPSPGATVSFMGYYNKIGRAKPVVPNQVELRRSWSNQLRVRDGKAPPPNPMARSLSASVLLPSLREAERAAKLAANGPPLGRIRPPPKPSKSPPKGSPGKQRPNTSPDIFSAARSLNSGGVGAAPGAATMPLGESVYHRRQTGRDVLSSMRTHPASGGMLQLQPLAQTSSLAASALSYAGREKSHANNVKEKAAAALGGLSGSYAGGALADMA